MHSHVQFLVLNFVQLEAVLQMNQRFVGVRREVAGTYGVRHAEQHLHINRFDLGNQPK